MFYFILFYGLCKLVYVVVATKAKDVLGGGRFHRELGMALTKEKKEKVESVGGHVK